MIFYSYYHKNTYIYIKLYNNIKLIYWIYYKLHVIEYTFITYNRNIFIIDFLRMCTCMHMYIYD